MRMARREASDSSAICRCRVLYLGSSVPQVTKDGLQGIQDPLRELYPSEGAVGARGIDSWLSVWSNGLLLENVDENQKKVTRFFPIESLHYCAAVRYVVVAGGEGSPVPRFLPLDSPFARNPNINHPPMFACIMRRVTGIKVLECHAFICKRETPANALVRCCFHAYADTMYAKSLETGNSNYGSVYGGGGGGSGGRATEELAIEVDYTGDLSSVNSEVVHVESEGSSPVHEVPTTSSQPAEDGISIFNGDENHKVWAGANKSESEALYSEYASGTMRSTKSGTSLYGTTGTSSRSRPRQMVMPSVAPPPPPAEPDKNGRKPDGRYRGPRATEDERMKMRNGARHQNGHHDRRVPVTGSLPRPMNGQMHPPSMNGSLMRAENHKSKSKLPKMFSSLSDRKHKNKRPPPPFMMQGSPIHPMGPPPPHFLPPQAHGHHMPPMPYGIPPGPNGPHGPPPYMQGPPMQGPPMPGPYGFPPPYGKHNPRAVEEPIYMPSSRPLSPTASYQPGHFPHEQYLLQQYATTSRPKGKQKKKKKSQKDDEEIYGRRSHINEKAFSLSIREEHRSRSYGSLVGLGAEESPKNKKDREIMQMVADLDLSADEIERGTPRPGMYRPPRSEMSGTLTSRNSRRYCIK